MKISPLTESSDHLKFLLSVIILFVNHGLRDYLITALPSIVSCPANATNASDVTPRDISLFLQTFRSLRGSVETYSSSSPTCDTEEGQSSGLIGATLSCVHWGWLITLMVAPFLIKRIPIKLIAGASLLLSGVLTLATELVAEETSLLGLLTLRTVQGALQGWCYPIVFILLEEVEVPSFLLPYFFIFLAPWIGSGLAVLMGWAQNPYVGAYVFGTLSTIFGGIMLCLPINLAKSELQKPEHVWRECLASGAVWACILLQVGMTWSLHHFLVGLSFTLQFKLNRSDLLWTIIVTILATGLATRLVAMVAMNLLRNHCLSPLNRRRFIILISSAVMIISLITIGTSGIDSEFVSFGMTMVGGVLGVSVGFVGVRLNLHDLGPLFPTPFLILGSAGAAFGAGMGSLLFPILSQVGTFSTLPADEISDKPWRLAWMIPILVLVVGCCIHLFLVSVIPLPHQTLITGNVNSFPPAQCKSNSSNIEVDTRSFKTSKSAFSFKTAVSRQRTRTVSFKTVDENIEADLQTVPESDVQECLSIVQDEADETEEMKSIASGATPAPSFKSALETSANERDYALVLSAQELDRTSAWLTIHHSTDTKLHRQNSAEKARLERNILLALQW